MSRNNQADQLIVNALKRKSATPGRPPKVYSPRSQSPLNPPPPSFGIGTSSSSQTEPSHNKQSRSLTTPQGQLSTHRDLTVVRPDIMSLPNSQSLNSGIPPVSAIAVTSPESGSWTELVMGTPSSSLSSGHVSAPDASPAVPKWSPSHPGAAMSIDDQIMTARQEAAGRLRIVNISSESYSVPLPSPRVLEVEAPRLDASLGHSIRRLEGFCRVPNPDLLNDDRYEQFEVAFHHIPKAFDSLRQDYLIEAQYISKCVEVEWLDPPGLLPADIRGRHGLFFVDERALATFPDRMVWRSVFRCSGNCNQIQPESEAREQHAGYEIIRMTPRSIQRGVCTLIRPKAVYHGQPNPLALLRISPHLRNLLHDAATLVGTTESRLRIRWYTSFCKIHPYVLWVKANYPERLPTANDFQTAIRTALRQERLDRLPLAAISILHSTNPESFLHCEYPRGLVLGGAQPFPEDSNFVAIVSPKHALQSAIRHASDRGLFLDSSWRNKNAIRCPVTFLATVNEYGHMVPADIGTVAVMVSNHANTDTYIEFLTVVRKAIKKEAKALVKGKSSVVSEYEDAETILLNAEDITEDGFLPLHFMIDCDDAERNAIEHVFPGAPIRLCQFHFMHSARSRALRLFGSDLQGTEKAFAFLVALRRCQRCSEEESWPEAFAQLEAEVVSISNNNRENWDKIRTWLLSEWFSDRWRNYLLDYGLPAHHTRDGTLSTNNFVEAAFRTFDRVFLESRANKRTDKLLAIIIDVYFPMYLHSPPTSGRCDPTVLGHILRGLELWEQGAVHECFGDEIPISIRGQFDHTFCVTAATSGQPSANKHYCGVKDETRERCSCKYFAETGKRCSGLWALYCFRNCGTSEDYTRGVTSNEIRMQSRAAQVSRRLADLSYSADQEDLVAYWGHDPSEPVWHDWSSEQPPKHGKLINIDSSSLDFVEPDSPIGRRNRFQTANTEPLSNTASVIQPKPEADKGGRPAAHRALHPYRQKTAPSKAGIRREALPSRERPVGAKNYLQSCFALSLFHVILRIPAFVTAFNEIKDALRPHAPSLIVLLEDFYKAISVSKRVVDLKEIVPLLRSESLIDQEAQHDPCELFLNLSGRINQIIEQNPIRKTFEFGVTWDYVFQPCAHFAPVAVELPTLEKQIVAATRARAKMTLHKENLPPMLLFNIVWDLRSSSLHQVIQSFDIPNMINPAQISAVPPTILPTNLPMYRLKGMLCRKGDTVQVTSGHYVALIKDDVALWEIDDETTSRMFLNRDAFTGTRFPVLLFYALEDGVNQGASQPLAKKRKLNKSSSKVNEAANGAGVGSTPSEVLKAQNQESKGQGSQAPNSELLEARPPKPNTPNEGLPILTENQALPATVVLSTTSTTISAPTDSNAGQPDVVPHETNPTMSTVPQDIEPPANKPPETMPSLSDDVLQKGGSQVVSESHPEAVKWRSGDTHHPLISVNTYEDVDSLSDELVEDLSRQIEAGLRDSPQEETRKGLRLQGLVSTFDAETLAKFHGRMKWYTNFGIDDILLSVSAFIRSCVNLGIGKSDSIPSSFVYRTLAAGDNWNPYTPGGTPWLSLGKDGQWRREITVGILMGKSHFGTLVIFGPQKLVLMYDGAGGIYDSPEQKKQWSHLLERRLDWEVKKGIATEAEAMGWLVAVNSQATRDSLEWATQVDSHSCGPLSCAAACLLLQGIKPTASALGLKSSNLARGESRKLRTSVLQLVLAMAARDPANEIFFTPKVKKQLEKCVPPMTYYIDRL
ncbi:hypothetical protein TREMEDRAFT_58784 [Tremella mesenterica DSM 1558]|nr:uncharacterized protein TREMEDRAFT_58784 [Tremella mesenterica DSM 1558]EIW72614.1 hypothetical protein TREMEDRAFT_58784 [Tremella mesenterica DSM 1558]